MSEIRGIDVKKGLSLLYNNSALYVRLLNVFASGTLFSDLTAAVAVGDPADISAKAHAVKGVAGNLSMTDLYDASLKVELAGKAGETITSDGELMTQITEIFNYTMDSVNFLIANPSEVENYK